MIIENYSQREGLAAVLEFIPSGRELKPIRITDDEDKNKSRIEIRLAGLLLIANKRCEFIRLPAMQQTQYKLPICFVKRELF